MKKYLGAVCLLYLGITIYLLVTGTISNYLAPTMHIYIKLSIIPLFLMALILLLSKDNHRFQVSSLILLLPLVMFILSSDGRLSLSFASNRITTNKIEEKVNEKKEEPKPVEEKKEEKKEEIKQEIKVEEKTTYDFTNVDIDVVDAAYDEVVNYLTFTPNAVNYVGKTIRIRGFTLKDESYIPSGYFLIGKYLVNCCVADSTYDPLFATYDGEVTNNGWYEIEGVLEKMPDNDNQFVLGIKVINIKTISSNDEELYIYPCYAYDDGLCEATKKYQFEY